MKPSKAWRIVSKTFSRTTWHWDMYDSQVKSAIMSLIDSHQKEHRKEHKQIQTILNNGIPLSNWFGQEPKFYPPEGDVYGTLFYYSDRFNSLARLQTILWTLDNVTPTELEEQRHRFYNTDFEHKPTPAAIPETWFSPVEVQWNDLTPEQQSRFLILVHPIRVQKWGKKSQGVIRNTPSGVTVLVTVKPHKRSLPYFYVDIESSPNTVNRILTRKWVWGIESTSRFLK